MCLYIYVKMADISELIIDVYNPHPIIPNIKPIALSAVTETTDPNHPKHADYIQMPVD